MWFARDIKSKIITRLTNSTYGITAFINTINTERTESTEVPLKVNAEALDGQYPAIFIDLGDSAIDSGKGSDENSLTEQFNLEITAVLKGNNITKLKNDCENYIEAIIRSLQGYHEEANQGTYQAQASGVIRGDIDTEQDQTIRAVTVNFVVYSNQI